MFSPVYLLKYTVICCAYFSEQPEKPRRKPRSQDGEVAMETGSAASGDKQIDEAKYVFSEKKK